jgi:hypothetical protein
VEPQSVSTSRGTCYGATSCRARESSQMCPQGTHIGWMRGPPLPSTRGENNARYAVYEVRCNDAEGIMRSCKVSRRRRAHATVQHRAELERARRCVRKAHISDGREALHFQAQEVRTARGMRCTRGVTTSRRESHGQYHRVRSTHKSKCRAQVELKAPHCDGDERRLDAHPGMYVNTRYVLQPSIRANGGAQ